MKKPIKEHECRLAYEDHCPICQPKEPIKDLEKELRELISETESFGWNSRECVFPDTPEDEFEKEYDLLLEKWKQFIKNLLSQERENKELNEYMQEPIKDWQIEFEKKWNKDEFAGENGYEEGQDFELLKQFIEKVIAQERDDIIRKFATGEFIKTDIAKKFEKEIRLKLKEEIREWAEKVKFNEKQTKGMPFDEEVGYNNCLEDLLDYLNK